MRRIPLFIAAAAALALPSTAAAKSASTVGCADVRYSYVERGTHQHVDATAVRARATSCQTARTLARRYAIAYRDDYGTPSQLLGLSCRWTRYGSDVGGARCRKGSAFVSFNIYDSSPYH